MRTNTSAIKHVAFVKMSTLRVSAMIDVCYWLTLKRLNFINMCISNIFKYHRLCLIYSIWSCPWQCEQLDS